MRRRLIALAAVLAVALAACGGDDDQKDSKTDIQSGTTSVTTATPTGAAAKLTNLVFVAADFPSGWTGKPSDDADDDDEADKAFATCIGASGAASAVAELDGDDFTKDQDQVSSSASIVKDAATYAKDVAALGSSKLSPCLEQQIRKAVGDQAPAGGKVDVGIADLPVTKHGDVTFGRRLTVTLSANGQSLQLFADFVLMGKQRLELAAQFLGFGKPVDSAVEKALLDKLGARLDAAPAP